GPPPPGRGCASRRALAARQPDGVDARRAPPEPPPRDPCRALTSWPRSVPTEGGVVRGAGIAAGDGRAARSPPRRRAATRRSPTWSAMATPWVCDRPARVG